MVDFLIQYKELISIIAVAIIEVCLLLFARRRPEIIDNSLVQHLTQWIIQAENKFRNGSDKMAYVLEKAKVYLGDDYIESQVRYMVEFLLEVPEKKKKVK